MVTKFDAGDVIQFEVKAGITSCCCIEDRYYYVISLLNVGEDNKDIPIFIDPSVLKECNAVKIENAEIGNDNRKESK